jgi:hypothetical protein
VTRGLARLLPLRLVQIPDAAGDAVFQHVDLANSLAEESMLGDVAEVYDLPGVVERHPDVDDLAEAGVLAARQELRADRELGEVGLGGHVCCPLFDCPESIAMQSGDCNSPRQIILPA